jgi:hypothetical protein
MSARGTVGIAGVLAWGTFAFGCGPGQPGGTAGAGGRGGTGGSSATTTETLKLNLNVDPNVDVLFVIDDWSSTSDVQAKLYDQLPLFLEVLQEGTIPLNLHLAVVTTDMGAPGDATASLGCTSQGDNGVFRSAPTGTCTDSMLATGATYLSDGDGIANFTGSMADVLQCIVMVGETGCGFGQPLAAAVHALGADNVQNGVPTPPAANAGFLRPDAYLAIIVVAERDDCSAPSNTHLFSLNGGAWNLTNPLGPLTHYRCNEFGQLCQEPAENNAIISPPLDPPSDAQNLNGVPTLGLTICRDNENANGLLIPVNTFVDEIKALKPNPDSQIFVAAIGGPDNVYSVSWTPALGGQAQPGELWPQMGPACTSTDGNIGEPGVRLAEFTSSFVNDGGVGSVCGADYALEMENLAITISQLPGAVSNCLAGEIQQTSAGAPNCEVAAMVPQPNGQSLVVPYSSCIASANTAPCWSLTPGTGACAGKSIAVTDAPGAPSTSITVSCSVCQSGVAAPGC